MFEVGSKHKASSGEVIEIKKLYGEKVYSGYLLDDAGKRVPSALHHFCADGVTPAYQMRVGHVSHLQRPHPCATKCPNFTSEPCGHCLVGGA